MRHDELYVALVGLGRGEARVNEFVGGEPGVPLRLAVVECLMWADTIRDEFGIPPRPLTVANMPWNIFRGPLSDPSA